jgi:hypothetical protein
MFQTEKNRLEGVAPQVRCSLERIIATLSTKKSRLKRLILQQIQSHTQLSRDHQLLCTIQGNWLAHRRHVCAVMRMLIHIASAYSNINSLSIPPSYDYTTALHFSIVSTTRMTPGA